VLLPIYLLIVNALSSPEQVTAFPSVSFHLSMSQPVVLHQLRRCRQAL